ncbi:MAG TPA: hypothetical protein VMW11_09985 [Candidatus Dormibacteraeota bacterium]|nr:hypothetical protein [Candidatus Dormibacteraeota bacterium]
MRRVAPFTLAALVACVIAAGCSSGPPKFSLDNETVDATFACPSGSENSPYPLHATLDAHNPTSATVTIQSVTAQLKLQAVKGPWLEKIGAMYDAGSAIFAPTAVPAGANAPIKVTITSACTSDKSIIAPLSYGEYAVDLRVTTSSGSYIVTSKNRHRIVAT